MTYRMGAVETATLRDIKKWGPEIEKSALAAVAINGARALDGVQLSPTGRSMLIAQVRETLLKLREMAPEEEENDAVDELARQRAARRGA